MSSSFLRLMSEQLIKIATAMIEEANRIDGVVAGVQTEYEATPQLIIASQNLKACRDCGCLEGTHPTKYCKKFVK